MASRTSAYSILCIANRFWDLMPLRRDQKLFPHFGEAGTAVIAVKRSNSLVEIEPGVRLVNVFRFSNRRRTVDKVEAGRLAALAREPKPHRSFERRREPKALKPPTPKPMTVERPRVMQRRIPSLPTMPWQDDGR